MRIHFQSGQNSPSYVRLEVKEGFRMANVLGVGKVLLLQRSGVQNWTSLNLLSWWLRSPCSYVGIAMITHDWQRLGRFHGL